MRFMKRVLSIMVAASSMVFALPVRADDPARLGKDDGFRERVLLARERVNPDGSMKQASDRAQAVNEGAATSDDQLGKDDGFRERVLLARERTNPDGSMKQRSLRTEVQIEKAAKSDDQASHAKSSTNSNIDDAFSDPILSSGP